MRPIRAIIVFNSGSAGDLLKALCLAQISDQVYADLKQSGRMDFNDAQYFKRATEQAFWQNQEPVWDWSQIKQVENTHFWSPQWANLASRRCFIDYPDSAQPEIMNIYLDKVFAGDIGKLLQHNIYSIPHALRHKISADNALDVFNRRWLRNFRSWRSDPTLEKINLKEMLDAESCMMLIRSILSADIDTDKFVDMYNPWYQRNTRLIAVIKEMA